MIENSLVPVTASDKSFPRYPANPCQHILVVEDDPAIRRLNTEVLTYSGYRVDAAADGAAAWEALQVNNYDLMVTDNEMPNITGVELIKRIVSARISVPVIMATGCPPDEQFDRDAPWQPAVVLLKPYTFDELVYAVKTVLFGSHEATEESLPRLNWQSPPRTNRLRL
jgi:DNA-binding response OmpR family regulator